MELEKKVFCPGLVSYSSKDTSRFLEKIGYRNFSKAVTSPHDLERNSDGTELKFFDWNNAKGLSVKCDGTISEFNIPGDRAWFDDKNSAVAWLKNRKVYYQNGSIEDPPFKAKGADPGGTYFVKGEGVVKIYSIEKPKMALAEVKLLGTGVLRLFTKEDKLYIFDYSSISKELEGYIFQRTGATIQLLHKLIIPRPTKKSYTHFVLDLSPWKDVVLILDRFDWPSRSKFYEFNLSTQQMKKVGIATQFGFYMQCDIIHGH